MADQGLEGSQPVDLSKHPSGIVPTLQNIVSTVNLDCKLDLKAIALQARNAEYNPKVQIVLDGIHLLLLCNFLYAVKKEKEKNAALSTIYYEYCEFQHLRFAAVIMRIREPKTTALIFASGKMVCTGAKSEQQSKLAARKYARIIQKLGFPAKFKVYSNDPSNDFAALVNGMPLPLCTAPCALSLSGSYLGMFKIVRHLTGILLVESWFECARGGLNQLLRRGRNLPPVMSCLRPTKLQVVECKRKQAKKGKEWMTIVVPRATASGTIPEPPMAVPLYRPAVATAPSPIGSCIMIAYKQYEPELFPGLIYRMKQPKIVLLIFVSGKIVLTGAKVRDETYTAFENIYPVLNEFRKSQQWYGFFQCECWHAIYILTASEKIKCLSNNTSDYFADHELSVPQQCKASAKFYPS
ncbi:hypothetical protein ACLOJK_033664 [Asimina triloba]